MRTNKNNLVSFEPANFDVSEICEENVLSQCHLAQLFLDTLAVILRKKSEIVGEHLWKCNLVDFTEILGSRCANTNLH